jgi:hypothetical protein
MTTHTGRIRQAIRIAILLGTASAAALANQSPTLISGARIPLCYCNCEKMAGAKKCTKMCELPQYANRWWAVSCHKKTSDTVRPSAPAPNSGSRKTNRKEEASL